MKRLEVLSAQMEPEYEVVGRVAVIRLINPPMNALGYKVRMDIVNGIERAEADKNVDVVVITGKGKAFSAGADIAEFQGGMKEPYLPEVINRVEKCSKVVVAAVNGLAMGGGTELALGCHYRVCAPKAFFALPEIKLGLIPGAGGTQRLPRLVGPQAAIQMCCTGRNVRAPAAKRMGLVDQISRGDVIADAANVGLAVVARKKKPHRLCNDTSMLGNFFKNAIIFRAARSQITKATPSGMISPLRALDAVIAATRARTFEDGLKEEFKIFMSLMASPQAKAMQHFFFAERLAARIPGLPPTKPRPVKSVGVVGGGLMGGGIAMNFLNVGVPVIIIETSEERRQFCLKSIEGNYMPAVKKRRMTPDQLKQRMGLLKVVVGDFSALADVDFVIEAVFESMKLKKEIFAKLDAHCKPECVLASNTSTLDVDEIASATKRPNKVIGAHFFSPANVMKLLEFIRGKHTDPEALQTAMAVGRKIKKAPVMVGNCFGFVANRMILKGGFQAMCMIEEGCFPFEVDRLIKKFGFPMGPFAMQDLAGLDIAAHIRQETPPHLLAKRDSFTAVEMLVKQKRIGQKSGRGWYIYKPEAPRKPVIDTAVERMVIDISKKKGIKRRHLPAKEITERYLFSLINEAAYILQEGFANRPSDIDIIFIYGFGFPPYRGGPCHYADFLTIPKVVEGIHKYNAALGDDTFPPACPLLVEMANSGKKFGDMNK